MMSVSKVIDLGTGTNRKMRVPVCSFLLVIKSNISPSCPVSEILHKLTPIPPFPRTNRECISFNKIADLGVLKAENSIARSISKVLQVL